MYRTAFYAFHEQHAARFVDFAGWQMPIVYQSIHEEHHHVRKSGGVFDVSHMGRIRVSGRGARRLLEHVLTRRISDMKQGTCRYALVCNEQGGTLDDVIVYRFEDDWLLVVNASNREKILKHLHVYTGELVVKIQDETMATAMVAVQGPKVMEAIGRFSSQVPQLQRYSFCVKNLLVMKMTISRTGYTGEDGVEVIMGANMAGMAIKLLLQDSGGETTLAPVGLGARDTLRLEAGMPLYGHELTEGIDPLSAGLDFAVSLDKDQEPRGEPFVGQQALKDIAVQGPRRRLIGLRLEGKRTARQGMEVLATGKTIGVVTSGCLSPTLGVPIAMAYVEVDNCGQGNAMQVNMNGKLVGGELTALPFYKR